MKRAWEVPLKDYVKSVRVISASEEAERNGLQRLLSLYELINDWKEFPVPECPDARFLIGGRDVLMIVDPETGDLTGGFTGFYPYIRPEYRGRNLNAQMNMILDDLGKRRSVGCYSPSGFGSRVATHRLHLERAMAAGHEIPEEVMVDYQIKDGRLSLREPYTPEAHNKWCEEIRVMENRKRYAHLTQDYEEVFLTEEEFLDGNPCQFNPNDDGYILAIALHREAGFGLLVHRQGRRLTVQSEMDGHVIDAFGVRPSDYATEDLERRGCLVRSSEAPDPFFGEILASKIEIRRYASEADLLESLSDAINDFALPGFSEKKVQDVQISESFRRIMNSEVLSQKATPFI